MIGLGSKHFRGDPCRKCSGTVRLRSTGTCVPCTNARKAEWRRNNREKIKASNAAHHAANPARRQSYNLRRYRLTAAQYAEISTQQAGVCAICAEPCPTGKRLAVDHCHDTGTVRGLLCSSCNLSLGGFKDSSELLDRASSYLRRHQTRERGNNGLPE